MSSRVTPTSVTKKRSGRSNSASTRSRRPRDTGFYKLAAENRAAQEEAFEAGRAWIGGGAPNKDPQSPGFEENLKKWNEAVNRWNEIVGKYNKNIYEMNRLTSEIATEMRKRG